MNNHYAKFENQGMKTFGKQDTLLAFYRKNFQVPDPKMKKKIMKCIQNKRCTFSMYEQSLCKV